FIAGGVGITPLRAMLEVVPARPGDVALLYRARSERDLLFRSELDELARRRGITVKYLLGRRRSRPDPLSKEVLAHLVPHIARADVFVCGPPGMMDVAVENLHALVVPRSQIHRERFEL